MRTLPRPTLLIAAQGGVADTLERDLAACGHAIHRARTHAHAEDLACVRNLDAAVVDQALGVECGVAFLARLRDRDPDIELVLLTDASIGAALPRLASLGALPVDRSFAKEGMQHLIGRARQRFVRRVSPIEMLVPDDPLTRRQRECLERALRHETHKVIAAEVGISAKTVRTHIERAYARLGVRCIEDVREVVRANTGRVLGADFQDELLR